MPEYNWSCIACSTGNDKSLNECKHCGCTSTGNTYDVEVRSVLLKNSRGSHPLECPNCNKRKLDVKYNQDPQQYYYRGMKARSPLFEILYVIIFCKYCRFEKSIEFKTPFFRKLFRKLMKRDVHNERLKRL